MTSSFGEYLSGEGGKSLYVLTRDSAGTSTCVDTCAQTWPPFVLESGAATVAGDGITGQLGVITRPDGSTQVAIDGMPLYYFAGDTGAGQTNGQGLNDVWFLASASGTPLSGSTPASPSSSSSRYNYNDAY